MFPSWLAPLQALTLVPNLRLGLRHESFWATLGAQGASFAPLVSLLKPSITIKMKNKIYIYLTLPSM
jgi:hypothetical protein